MSPYAFVDLWLSPPATHGMVIPVLSYHPWGLP